MFRNIISDRTDHATRVIIRKKGLNIASFRGECIIGQIEDECVKSITTEYDSIKKIKTVIVEV